MKPFELLLYGLVVLAGRQAGCRLNGNLALSHLRYHCSGDF